MLKVDIKLYLAEILVRNKNGVWSRTTRDKI